MTEDDLVRKVEELMNLVDQVKLYRKALAYIPDLAIAVLSVTCVSLLIFILVKICFITSGIFSSFSGFTSAGSYMSPEVALLLFLLPSLWATVIGMLLIELKVKKVRTGEWSSLLKEGAPAAIKLLMETDWESLFSGIMLMKLWLAIKMLNWLFLSYIIILPIFQSLFILLPLPLFWTHKSIIGLITFVLVTPIILLINKKNIKEFYRNIKSIDLLIIDLRWLYNELKGARLEA
ncbi:MAG: hypothetical protein QXS51_01200 [Thermoproteota archaeon]|nr:hypothetical protein [Candidatus Brockarchaeota archaeon]